MLVKQPLEIDEDVRNEFRMHSKLLITEVSRYQTKQDKDGSIRRSLQPISKTICSFLNTDGGRIYIGVDDSRVVKGITMSKNMISHFFGSLRHMCEQFRPFNPVTLLKVSILEVQKIEGDDTQIILKKADLDKVEPNDIPRIKTHSVGGIHCDCFNEIHLAPTKKYLLVVHVQRPDPTKPTIIFQNEEGLAYRRRLASNKCVYLDDLRRMVNERNHVFVDLHDEVRHEIDRFIKFH